MTKWIETKICNQQKENIIKTQFWYDDNHSKRSAEVGTE